MQKNSYFVYLGDTKLNAPDTQPHGWCEMEYIYKNYKSAL